jgi:hypothetical protein
MNPLAGTDLARRSVFDRFAATVADFGSPFYAEERQRDVWNEASAFGFQLLLWAGVALSGAMFWLGGRPVAPYGLALLLLVGLGAMLVVLYARRLGVEPDPRGAGPLRLVMFLALYLLVLVGAVRTLGSGNPGFLIGLVCGGGTALVALYLGLRSRDRAVADD